MAAASRERILVVGKPYLGDTVLALPVLRNLRAAFPGQAIDFLVEGTAVASILRGCPYVDEVLRWERPPRPPRGGGLGRRPLLASLASVETAAATLRPRRYERAYLLKRSPSAALLAVRAGIPHRVGQATLPGGPLLTRSVRWRSDRHHGDCLLDLLRADGLPVDDGGTRFWEEPRFATARVEQVLAALPAGRPRVFVGVRATDWRRQWPLDRWVDALRRLVAEHGCEIVFCGGDSDTALTAAVTAGLGAAAAHIHDFSTTVSLGDLPALAARMDMYLGVNTGLMHVAAASGIPVVAIFDRADAVRWRPRGGTHAILCGADGRRTADRSRRPTDEVLASGAALAGVTAATVVDAAAACLAARQPRTRIRTLDLRTGRHRYEVEVRSVSGPAGVPAVAVAGA